MLADMTAEQLQDACHAVYEVGKWKDAPAQIFLDQFSEAEPPTTILRCSFPDKFTHAGACKLDLLRKVLLDRHGIAANIVFVVYFEWLKAERLARYSLAMNDR
jgi:hypothetical protein